MGKNRVHRDDETPEEEKMIDDALSSMADIQDSIEVESDYIIRLDDKQREKLREAHVPGWNLVKYIASGAYGDVFLARQLEDENQEGIYSIIKIFRLKDDAIADLKKIGILGDNPSAQDITSALENNILRKEAMIKLKKVLRYDEEGKEYINLPQSFIPDVISNGIVTYASINERLDETLEDRLNKKSCNSYKEILEIIVELTKAVKVAHKNGFCHNDIKPSNIGFILHQLKLFDFGVATSIGSSYKLNYPNVGALSIRAPELLPIGSKPSTQSDIWQIGCLIYNLVTMEKPFRYSLGYKHKGEEGREEYEKEWPDRIKETLPQAIVYLSNVDVPKSLIDIAKKCLAFKKEERYVDASELLIELEEKRDDILLEVMALERKKRYNKKIIEDALKNPFIFMRSREYPTANGIFTGIVVEGTSAAFFDEEELPEGLWFSTDCYTPQFERLNKNYIKNLFDKSFGFGGVDSLSAGPIGILDSSEKYEPGEILISARKQETESVNNLVEFVKRCNLIGMFHNTLRFVKERESRDKSGDMTHQDVINHYTEIELSGGNIEEMEYYDFVVETCSLEELSSLGYVDPGDKNPEEIDKECNNKFSKHKQFYHMLKHKTVEMLNNIKNGEDILLYLGNKYGKVINLIKPQGNGVHYGLTEIALDYDNDNPPLYLIAKGGGKRSNLVNLVGMVVDYLENPRLLIDKD